MRYWILVFFGLTLLVSSTASARRADSGVSTTATVVLEEPKTPQQSHSTGSSATVPLTGFTEPV